MDELGAALGEPDADFDELMAEMAGLQTELDHSERLGHRLTA